MIILHFCLFLTRDAGNRIFRRRVLILSPGFLWPGFRAEDDAVGGDCDAFAGLPPDNAVDAGSPGRLTPNPKLYPQHPISNKFYAVATLESGSDLSRSLLRR